VPAYFLRADVANFFNSIDRPILIDLAKQQIPKEWIRVLIRQIVLHDPPTIVSMRSGERIQREKLHLPPC
jgi:RNA-directed DNA polymerase